MKFKDVYKSANSRISANKEILNTLLENNNEKSWYGYFPRVATSLAVAVILFAVVFLNSPASNDVKPNKIVLKNDTTTQQIGDKQGTATFKTSEKEDIAAKPKVINEFSEETEIIRENSENDTVSAPVLRETQPIYKEYVEEAPLEESVGDLDLTPPSQAYSGGVFKSGGGAGSGGAAYSVSSEETEKNVEFLSYKEYFGYIGLSIKNNDILFSKDVSLFFPDSYIVTKDEYTGDIIDDSVSFTFSSQSYPEIAATLTLGKVNPPQIAVGDLQIIANHKVYIRESNGVVSARFIIGDAWFSFTSAGLQRHEAITLLSEFLTNKIS